MEYLQDKPASFRKSRQREEILKVLQGTTLHPTADWIYLEVKKNIPSVSLGTIYRNLRILQETGEILELKSNGSLSHFDGRTDDHHHFHCERCGYILDVEKGAGDSPDFSAVHNAGCTIKAYRLEFYGICHNCNNRCN